MVKASEKSTGKSDNITVTNEKSRLSKDDIDKMVADAEKFKENDEKSKEVIDSRNNLESTIYQMKSTLSDEKMSSLFDSELKDSLNKIIDENVSWLESNQMASKEEYDGKLSEFQEAMKPVQEKMMAGMQGMPDIMPGGMPGGMPDIMPDIMPGGMPGGMPDMPKSHPSDETTHGTPKVVDIDDVD